MTFETESTTTRQIRVFICDDVAEVRLLVRTALDHDPDVFVVGEAADGTSALEGIAASNPDVVVLDLAMPHADGLQVLRELRAREEPIRVVVFSGFGAPGMSEAVRDLGAACFIPKGSPLTELRDAILDVPAAAA